MPDNAPARRGPLLAGLLALAAACALAAQGCSRPAPQPEGFEGELAKYLAEKLGVKSKFVHNEWDQLPQDLKRGNIDVILNGYEWSQGREQAMASSVPYYAYQLRLIVKKGSPIRSWDDLVGQGRKMRVGVLKDSAAERYLEQRYGERIIIEALSTEGTTGVMLKVQKGALDATVQDAPVASCYLDRKPDFPELEAVGEPISPVTYSYYVAFVRPECVALREKIDQALREGLADGSIKRIYEKYGLWGPEQEKLAAVARRWPPVKRATTNLPDPGLPKVLRWGGDRAGGEPYIVEHTGPPGIVRFARDLGTGALLTIALAFTAMPVAMLIGLLVALARLYGPPWATWPLGTYVEVIRGTPVLLQLAVIYYLLPTIGVRLPAFWAGALGLALNYGAYEAENYRAGLLAVPRGQMEAALSLGMSRWVALRRAIVPQAVRTVIPPVTNDFISLFKDTSICSAIAVTELTARYRTLAVNNPSWVLQLGLMTALLYLLMSYPLSLVARQLERRHQHVAG
jgi:polar amino acid transport system substrate-binding protein